MAGHISNEKMIQNIILICRELPGWQNICGDNTSANDLIASDIHLAIMLTLGSEELELASLPMDTFCGINLSYVDESRSNYNHLCVFELISNKVLIEHGLKIEIKDSISICSATGFWLNVCTGIGKDNYFPEVDLLSSSFYFHIHMYSDLYISDSNNLEKISPLDFCTVSTNMILKGDIIKHFNAICINELSTPSELPHSEISWFPSTRSAVNICKNNPLWIKCEFSDEYEKLDVLNSYSDDKEPLGITDLDKISLLATTLLQQIHQLPIYMFSSQYYQFADIDDLCTIANIIKKDIENNRIEKSFYQSEYKHGNSHSTNKTSGGRFGL
ncbi:large cysteine rich protein [Cryptosporidium felis]|nr:large cysteine rich protein [Cryptosporidium felis]